MLKNKETGHMQVIDNKKKDIDNKKKDIDNKKKDEVDNKKKDLSKDFSILLSDKGKFSTCCGCSIECDPRICDMLTEWLG